MSKHDSTLRLTISQPWFNMICLGDKLEEYREIKPYWLQRLIDWGKRPSSYNSTILQYILHDIANGHTPEDSIRLNGCTIKQYASVEAKNGYTLDSPIIKWIPGPIRIGTPNPIWCPPNTDATEPVFIIPIVQVVGWVGELKLLK